MSLFDIVDSSRIRVPHDPTSDDIDDYTGNVVVGAKRYSVPWNKTSKCLVAHPIRSNYVKRDLFLFCVSNMFYPMVKIYELFPKFPAKVSVTRSNGTIDSEFEINTDYCASQKIDGMCHITVVRYHSSGVLVKKVSIYELCSLNDIDMESFTQAMVGNLIRHFGIDFTSDIWAGVDLPKYYFGGDTYIV